MYEFHYDQIQIKYSNNSGLLFIDTDSWMYEIKTDYLHENLTTGKNIFTLVIILLV